MTDSHPCEICTAPSRYWDSVAGYKHYLCSRCSHLFVFPKPLQRGLDAYYQNASYYHSAEMQSHRLYREANERVILLERLRKRFDLKKRLLDVGCASGYFLNAAIERGWNVVGQDRSVHIAQRARTLSGARVVDGIFEDTRIPSAPFPIVTAWEIIEHTVNPRMFFAALSQNVAPGGLLAISTPLANGLPARVLKTKFPMLIPPEHLSIFTRKSIGILAREFGFEEIVYRSFSNLTMVSLASGFCKLFGHDELTRARKWVRYFCFSLGLAFLWAPKLVDMLGYGTEMLIIFKRVNR